MAAVEVLGRGTLLHSGPGLYLRGSVLAGLFAPVLAGVVLLIPDGLAVSSASFTFTVSADSGSIRVSVLHAASSVCIRGAVFSEILSAFGSVLSSLFEDSVRFSDTFSVEFSGLFSSDLSSVTAGSTCVTFGGDESSLEYVRRLLRGISPI